MSRAGVADVALGPGLVDGAGSRHRRARLRAVTGDDEERAAGFGAMRLPEDVADLLAGLVERLGGHAPVTPGLVAALTRGDRDRLLLAIRAGLAGDEVRMVTACPNPGCGELVEVVLSVAELLSDEPGREDATVVTTPEGAFQVRLPRGDDDAAVAHLPGHWRAEALWRRIVEPAPGGASPATRGSLAAALAELAAAAGAPDLMRVARCPDCAAWIELDPEPVDLLARALHTGAGRLLAEVHCLAFHYGWAEAAILAMARRRRHRYLDLVRRQLEGRPLEDAWAVPR